MRVQFTAINTFFSTNILLCISPLIFISFLMVGKNANIFSHFALHFFSKYIALPPLENGTAKCPYFAYLFLQAINHRTKKPISFILQKYIIYSKFQSNITIQYLHYLFSSLYSLHYVGKCYPFPQSVTLNFHLAQQYIRKNYQILDLGSSAEIFFLSTWNVKIEKN